MLVFLNNTLEGYFLYLFLSISKLDIALRGLLVIISRSKVATIVGYLVTIG